MNLVSASRETQDCVESIVARVRADGADSSRDAIIVGSRAGVVEWTNSAWTRITGFSAAETNGKPIGHFLAFAGIELELVDFVGQHFLEGRSCMIEFPFETSDDREIRIHLQVQPIHDERGEPSTFLATARVLDDAPESETILPASNARPTRSSAELPRPLRRETGFHPARPLDLSDSVRRACDRSAARSKSRICFDLCLDSNLPGITLPFEGLEELASRMIESASHGIGEDWGTLSISTGRAAGGRSHISQVHPQTARLPEFAARPAVFLEVHDSGPALPREALERIRGSSAGVNPRESALLRVRELSEALGAIFFVQSAPGCGNQSLVLFPILEIAPDASH